VYCQRHVTKGYVFGGNIGPHEKEIAVHHHNLLVLFESLDYPASFQSLRNIFWGVLQHPLHVFLFDALTPLMNCCRAVGDIGDAARVCTNIISSLEKVIPGYSLEVANFYFCLGEMYSERAESSNSLPAIAKRYRKQVHHFEAIGKMFNPRGQKSKNQKITIFSLMGLKLCLLHYVMSKKI
jgi:hypothetical protein